MTEKRTVELIVCPKKNSLTLKGTFVSYPKGIEFTCSFQREFAKAVQGNDTTEIGSFIEITPNNTVLGIPFTWWLSPDGGVFAFWLIGEVSRDRVKEAKRKLSWSQDIASVFTEKVELIGWNPPEPFRAEPIPNWLGDLSYSYIDGQAL
ncbi:MAG: hypothetical protein ABEK59_07145 [Halobacteria archaeon]